MNRVIPLAGHYSRAGSACFATPNLVLTFILVVFSNHKPCCLGQVVAPVSVNGTATTVTSGSIINVTNAAVPGLHAINPGGAITANGITVNLQTGATIGAFSEAGGVIHLNGTSITTVTTTTGQRGVLSVGADSLIDGTGTSITVGAGTTVANNLNAVRVESGGAVTFVSATLATRGGVNGTLNHAVFATGADSTISLTGGTVTTLARGSSGVRAEDGAVITLNGTQVTTTGTHIAAGFFGSHALHALGAGTEINGTGVILNVSGATGTGNAAFVESGGSISLISSSLTAGSSSPTDVAPSSAVRVSTGGTFEISGAGSTIAATGTRGHGVTVQDVGSSATISDTAITVSGPRAYGIQVTAGGTAIVTDSSILVTQLGGVQMEGAGSTIDLTDTTVRTTGPTSMGVRALTGSAATINGGSVTTEGRDSAGLMTGSASITATNVTVRTTGIDNSMGALADLGGFIELTGGSVTTTGNSVRAGARAHGLAARNPGGVLIATGTTVLTQGEEAMGVVADDGGTVTLLNNAIRTENRLGIGLFAVVEQVGAQFPASITGTNLTVETFGLNGYGALAQQNFLEAPALVDISNSRVTTHGENAVGLRAVSGGTVIAHQSVVFTEGLLAHGMLARSNPSSVTVNNSTVLSTGTFAHGAVAENGGLIVGNNSLVTATGNLSAALFAIGDDGTVSVARFTNSQLVNRSGPTIAVAGAANITLTNSFAGGSGEWLRVGSAVDFPPLRLPENPITGIPDTPDPEFPPDEPESTPMAEPDIVALAATPGLANIVLSGSTVVGSAFTTPGSVSNLTMLDNSFWHMTGSSNITNLHIVDSVILFSAPTGPEFKILTLNGNLSGQRGLFGMNTDLRRIMGDLLVIEGLGQGNHRLLIFNRGGSPTGPGQALRVVQTTDGAAGARFRLANPGEKVEAGVFVYRLRLGNNRGNTPDPTAWYLVNEITNGNGGSGGGGEKFPELSAEGQVIVGTSAVLPVIWFDELDNLHERMGELRLGFAPPATRGHREPQPSQRVGGKDVVPVNKSPAPVQPVEHRWDVWMRGYGSRLKADPGLGGSFDEYLWGLALGADRTYRLEKSRFWLGVFGGYSGIDRDFEERGEGETDSIYGGVYGTWLADSGWYLDLVGKINRFENDLDPVSNIGERSHSSYDNWGLGLSVELGRQFPLGHGWFVEPQLQGAYTYLTDEAYVTESGIRVQAGDANVVQLRAGLLFGCRIERSGAILQPYLRASVVDALTDGGRIDADGASLHATLDGVRFEGGAGIITQLTSRDQLYMEYTASFGEKIDQPWSISLGFRRLW